MRVLLNEYALVLRKDSTELILVKVVDKGDIDWLDVFGSGEMCDFRDCVVPKSEWAEVTELRGLGGGGWR